MAKASKNKKEESKPEPSVLAALQSTSRNARTHLTRHLVKAGLYAGQEAILEIIDAHGPIASGGIAQKLGVRPPTITKSLTRLEEQGIIQRTPENADKRIVVALLTKQGKAALKKARKATRKAEKQLLTGLTEKQLKQMQKALEQISTNFTKTENGASKGAKS